MAKNTEKPEEEQVKKVETMEVVEEKKSYLELILATQSISELISVVSQMSAEERNKVGGLVADQMDKFIGR